MNFAARLLLPLLTINLNEGGEAPAGGGGGGGGGGAGEGDSSADGKGGTSSEGEGEGEADAAAAGKGGKGGEDKDAAKQAAAKQLEELTKSYKDFKLKLPEQLKLADADHGNFVKAALEAGVKPDQLQKLADVFAGAEMGRLKAVAAELKREEEGWSTALKSDKELAGENGEKLEATKAAATRAMNKLATPKFRQLLEQSRLAKHPEMIRIMARAGAGMAEDSTSSSKAGNKGAEKTPAQKAKSRWPNSPELHNPS